MKVIVSYWIDEVGYPRSIERVSTSAKDLKEYLQRVHPESRILWFDSPASASKRTAKFAKEHLLNKDGFEYLQHLVDTDQLGYCGANIAYYDPETDFTGHIYRYGFQVRNLH